MEPVTALIFGAVAIGLYAISKLKADDELPDDELPDDEPLPPPEDDEWADLELFDEDEPYDPPDDEAPNKGFPTSPAPPNISGDPAGYSKTFFPSYLEIRNTLTFLGYDVAPIDAAPPASAVSHFQEDYNEATANGHFMDATGYLKIDGKAYKKTYNAMQIAATGLDGPQPQDIVRGSMWKTEFDLWEF